MSSIFILPTFTGELTAQVDWLCPRVGSHLAPTYNVLHLSDESSELLHDVVMMTAAL